MKSGRFVVGAMLWLAGMVFALSVLAGDLNPPGPPAPTMKTLDQVQPTWDQVLPAAERFKPVMGGAAVLDKETGLVWEKSPASTTYVWTNAVYRCLELNVGGRKGWHLPTAEQLASLVDTSLSSAPTLPSGHPFTNVQTNKVYWTVTTKAGDTSYVWGVSFFYNPLGSLFFGAKTVDTSYAWCVRGGQSNDGQ